MPNIQIILASGSPRRKELLRRHGIRFRVIVPNVSERSEKKRPSAIVQDLALRKARFVARKLRRGLVLGADTIVAVGGMIIGKPRDRGHALRILKLINGKRNEVYTGVALVDASTGTDMVRYEKSTVTMNRLPESRLKIFAQKHIDKAGAYAVQEKNDAFVKDVIGDYTNVVGLPVLLLKQMLKEISRMDRSPPP